MNNKHIIIRELNDMIKKYKNQPVNDNTRKKLYNDCHHILKENGRDIPFEINIILNGDYKYFEIKYDLLNEIPS